MEAKLTRFSQDPENLNKGTDRGRRMLSQSIQDLGAGRSILVDRNGVIIAGNKTAEAAIAEGLEDAIVVQTQGDKVVVVQRTDLDLTKDPKAKQLAIADNRIAEIDLSWDAEALQKVAEEVDLSWLEVDDSFLAQLESFRDENNNDDDGEEVDPDDVWKGMPEFEQEDKQAPYSIKVNFYSIEDINDFAERIGQKVTDKTKWINHPFREHDDMSLYSCE